MGNGRQQKKLLLLSKERSKVLIDKIKMERGDRK